MNTAIDVKQLSVTLGNRHILQRERRNCHA